MDIQKRLIGPCARFESNVDDVKVDMDALIWRLILFDTYILASIRLKEIPHLVKVFGYDGVNSLLSSGILKIYCDATMPAQTGQTSVIKSRMEKGVLPLCSYSFSMICPHDRKKYISDCLQNLHNIRGFSLKKVIKLKQSVASGIIKRPENYCVDTLNQLKQDLIDNSRLIKILTTKALFNRHRIISHPDKFFLKIHQIDDDDFQSETNLGVVYGLKREEVHKVIEKALLALGSLNQRIEDMNVFSAITISLDKDLPLFREKLSILAESVSPKSKEIKMQRIVEIRGLPCFKEKNSALKINIEKLLRIRERKECREFRDWISSIDIVKDIEMSEYISSIKSTISPFIHGLKGRIIRFFVNTGISFLPAGIILGPVISAIDSFLLNKIFPYSGPIIFINRLYPSIFIESNDFDGP